MASTEAERPRAASRRTSKRPRARAAVAVAALAVVGTVAAAAPAQAADGIDCAGLSDARCAILDAGRSLIGTPYDLVADAHVVGYGHNASTPGPTVGTGGAARVDLEAGALDCSGFVRYVYAAAGIDLGAGPTDSQVDRFTHLFDQVGDEPARGDLVFFGARVASGAETSEYTDPTGQAWDVRHVAVYVGDGLLMESTRVRDGVAEPREVYSWPADGVERIGYFALRADVDGAAVLDGPPGIFADVHDQDPFADDIRWLRDTGLTTVARTARFRPDDDLRRDEAAALLHRLAGSPQPTEGLVPPGDVAADHPFADAMAWLAGTGIAGLRPDGGFAPGSVVTRGDFAELSARLVGAQLEEGCPGAFEDVEAETPRCPAIGWMGEGGIAVGFPDGTFRPEAPVTRAVAAAFLHRLATYLFPDVSLLRGDHASIRWVATAGVARGFDDGTFRPDEGLDRGAAVAFLHRVAGAPRLDPEAAPPFADVDAGDPFAPEIAWAASAGVIDAAPAGELRPAEAVTRAEFARMLLRLSGEQPPAACDGAFADVDAGPGSEAICWLDARGIARGYDDGTFRPSAELSRAAAAVMLDRYAARPAA